MNNYLYRLKHKINCLPESYVNDIVQDYQSYFYEGKEDGKTEDEMISELGDVEYIANNIIAEYFIENSNKINGITTYSKAIKAVIELGVGALNLMIMIPVILSVFAILASLYFSGIVFIISPVFLVAHIIDPRLPIYFGTDIAAFKFIIVSLMVAFGLLIIKISNKFSSKICGWSFRYIIKSIKFKAIKLNDIVR